VVKAFNAIIEHLHDKYKDLIHTSSKKKEEKGYKSAKDKG